jgi:hypothetical protein
MSDTPKKLIEGFANIEEDENGNIKVVFDPGCFDDFEGTQEELDETIKQITEMFQNGDLETMQEEAVDIEDLAKTNPELANRLLEKLIILDDDLLTAPKRSLQ